MRLRSATKYLMPLCGTCSWEWEENGSGSRVKMSKICRFSFNSMTPQESKKGIVLRLKARRGCQKNCMDQVNMCGEAPTPIWRIRGAIERAKIFFLAYQDNLKYNSYHVNSFYFTSPGWACPTSVTRWFILSTLMPHYLHCHLLVPY